MGCKRNLKTERNNNNKKRSANIKFGILERKKEENDDNEDIILFLSKCFLKSTFFCWKERKTRKCLKKKRKYKNSSYLCIIREWFFLGNRFRKGGDELSPTLIDKRSLSDFNGEVVERKKKKNELENKKKKHKR